MRMSNSLPVQHNPTRFMPFAPTALARAIISGMLATLTIISERIGL